MAHLICAAESYGGPTEGDLGLWAVRAPEDRADMTALLDLDGLHDGR